MSNKESPLQFAYAFCKEIGKIKGIENVTISDINVALFLYHGYFITKYKKEELTVFNENPIATLHGIVFPSVMDGFDLKYAIENKVEGNMVDATRINGVKFIVNKYFNANSDFSASSILTSDTNNNPWSFTIKSHGKTSVSSKVDNKVVIDWFLNNVK